MKKTSRQLQKEQTKKHLIQTAYEVFSHQGIIHTRMSDIAKAAGVSHGTVFLHFSTQEDLIEEVITTYCEKIAVRTHELADAGDSLEKFLRTHLTAIAEFEPLYKNLVIENHLLPPGAKNAWVMLQSIISSHFEIVLQKHFQVTPDILPTDLLFNTWIGLVHYYLANSLLFAPKGNLMKQ